MPEKGSQGSHSIPWAYIPQKDGDTRVEATADRRALSLGACAVADCISPTCHFLPSPETICPTPSLQDITPILLPRRPEATKMAGQAYMRPAVGQLCCNPAEAVDEQHEAILEWLCSEVLLKVNDLPWSPTPA